MTTGLIKSRRAATEMVASRLAGFTANRDEVKMATGANAPLAGVTDAIAVPSGQLVDIIMSELAPVQAGGTIAAGDRITSDAQGRAVKATKQAGATVYTIGVAQEPALENDIFNMLVVPGAIDG